MDQELKTELLKYMDRASNFVAEQAPVTIRDVLLAGKIDCLGRGFVFLVGICFVGMLCSKCKRIISAKDTKDEDAVFAIIVLVMGYVSLAIMFVGLVANIVNLIEIYVAPRAYIISLLK